MLSRIMRFVSPSGRPGVPILLLCLLPAVFLLNVDPCSADYSMTYEATGSFSPADGAAGETLTGNFAISPWLCIQLPDGSVTGANPPTYLYDGLFLSSNNHTVTMGVIDQSLPQISVFVPAFGYTDQNVFFTNPVVLARSLTGQGWNNGMQYWQFTQLELDPVTIAGGNYLSFDGSGNYYPSNIHFTYTLNDVTGTITAMVYPPGEVGPLYSETTDYAPIGTLSFDATPAPIPSAVWLFSSGLVGLIGLKKNYPG